MFKNLLIYRIGSEWSATAEQIEEALNRQPFQPCSPSQEKSAGWVPPRGEAHAPLVETLAGHRILRFMIESKSVPGPVIQRKLEEHLQHIEATTGRKPGRKESREIKDELKLELLPQAFARTSSVTVWIDTQTRRLVLDTGSQARADEVITALVKALNGLDPRPVNTQMAPQAAMAQWLTGSQDEWPPHFGVGREVELKSGDEMQSVVKFTRHHLHDEEMRHHIGQGKRPTRLALDWDGRVAFVLTEGLQLKKISFLDGVFQDNATAEEAVGFDADAAITTGELSGLLTDLFEALGGETT